MRALLLLHHGLQEIGKAIGLLARLGLALALFFGATFALLMTSVYAAYGAESLTGGGTFVMFVMFWVFVGLIGWYVAPHAQPQISKAMLALFESS